MKTNNNIKNFNKYYKHYQKEGYVLVKNFLSKQKCKQALNWLNSKNKKKS